MNILVACEESQRVADAFRKRGHKAFSCDILPTSGQHPEYHIQGDVVPLINGHCIFETMDGKRHSFLQCDRWDMIIAFPPCTYLTTSGNAWYNVERYGEKALQRCRKREEAFYFFMAFVNADCERIAIENPCGYANTHYRKPDQIIHPYFFGDPEKKRTCLWLKNLPKLKPTNKLEEPKPLYYTTRADGTKKARYFTEGITGVKDRAKTRSKTFPGIARAMGDQWG